MKEHLRFGMALTLGLAFGSIWAGADTVHSLRGEVGIPDPSLQSERARVINDKEPIARTFKEQPPLVPHKVDEYEVNLTVNKCLDCHSKEKAKEKDATAVSESHYQTREGKKLDTLASRRYFCTQCHVPQVDTEPLVENVFQSVVVTQQK